MNRPTLQLCATLLAGLTLAVCTPAQAHHPVPTGLEALEPGLFNAGLLPGSTSLGVPLGDAAPPSQQTASVAAAAESESPLRVFVLVVDGLLPTQIGAQTPTLSDLKDTSTWYSQARSVVPAETLPNHAAMATGVAPQKNGIVANQIVRGHTPKEYMQHPEFWDTDTIVTRLERAYKGRIDTATILGKEYLWGLFRGEFEGSADPRAQREADFHWDPRTASGYVPNPSSHVLDQSTMDALLEWTESEKSSPRPQFAFVNLADVDRAGHADAEGAGLAAADRAANNKDELSGAFATPFQQGALTSTDTQISRFVTALQDGGMWDESVVIVLSDHGMDWGPAPNIAATQSSLVAANYLPNDQDDGAGTGDYKALGGGGSELIYVYDKSNIAPMARVLCGANGIAVVTTREPVSDLNADPDNPTCKGRTHGELGIDHPYSADIEVFLEPTWRSSPMNQSENPLPGNHGHAVTQHNTLFVTGGHPALDQPDTVAGTELVYKRNDVALPGGPGVLSVAPTVAALFGIGKPAGGYDVPPLTEAFEPGTLDLSAIELVRPDIAGGEEDHGAPDGDEEAKPVLTVGVDVKDATLTQATYTFYVANRGKDVARDVMLTNAVPTRTTFASALQPAVGGAACVAGAAPGTQCRWSMGDLQPGQSKTVDVTYNLTGTTTGTVSNSVSAQLAGAAPNATADPTDTDSTLEQAFRPLLDDTHVNRGATADKNYGGCNQLEIGAANALTAFLDEDLAFRKEAGAESLGSRTMTLYAAELRATTKTVTGAGGGTVQISAHRISSPEWEEGFGTCGGALENGNPAHARDADSGSVPASDAGPLATSTATAPGEPLTWDITAALDDRQRRRDFNGIELRLFGASAADGASASLHSGEAPAANQPRLVFVRTIDKENRCVSADPESATRNSDQVQRIRAYLTRTSVTTRQTSAGVDVCNGMPAAGAPVGWEIDDDSPDAYIASAAGRPTDRETGANGGTSPDRVSTVTGPSGRTFIDLQLADPHPGGDTPATTRVAAIALDFEHDAYHPGIANRTGQGVCDPGEPAAFSTGPQTCAGSGEALSEDDVTTNWKPVARPPDPGPGGGGAGDTGTGGDTGAGGANDIDGVGGANDPAPTGGQPAPAPSTEEPGRTGESSTPPRRGRVSIGRGRLRMNARRVVRVPIRCSAKPRGGCAGQVRVLRRMRGIGKRRYELRAGRTAKIRVRIAKRAAVAIRRQNVRRVRVRATNPPRAYVSRRMRLTH